MRWSVLRFLAIVLFFLRQGGYVFTRVCSLAGWLVCQQNFTKAPQRISMKLGCRTGLGPE